MTRRRVLLIAAAVVVLFAAVGGIAAAVASGDGAAIRQQVLRVPVGPDADGQPVSLDATLYLPASRTPAPAIVLAHGFGGTKDDERSDALFYARHGYVVLAYTARGFGDSGGRIELDSPRYEVADAERLVDLLARRPEVLRDGTGDPRVGFAGPSYGGALSLLVAAYDHRVDAIAPSIAWNNLATALFPQSAVDPSAPANTPAAVAPIATTGVFQKAWAAQLFGVGALPSLGSGAGLPTPSGSPSGGPGTRPGGGATQSGASASPSGSGASGSGTATPDTATPDAPGASGATGAATPPLRPTAATCGRFAADLCAAYQTVARTGQATPRLLALLTASSPSTVIDRVKAPTLLIQGEDDSLFPLGQADANARGIAANGTPVSVAWYGGGHSGGQTQTDWQRSLTLAWFDHYLRHEPVKATQGFEFQQVGAAGTGANGNPAVTTSRAPGYPGLGEPAAPRASVALRPPRPGPQVAIAPAGGSPAELTGLPGLGDAAELLGTAGIGLPGQDAVFTSAPLTRPLSLAGAPRVTLRVTSSGTGATLFAKLYDVAPGGDTSLPEQLVAPIRLTGLTPGTSREITVSLPAVVHDFAVRHRLRLAVSTTDQAYQLPVDPAVYRISLAGDGAVSLPESTGSRLGGGAGVTPWVSLALAVLLIAALVLAGRARRTPAAERGGRPEGAVHGPGGPDREADGTSGASSAEPGAGDDSLPLVVAGLGKAYKGGLRAVTDLALRVEPGQVVGLLGPNGAGKTTTLRMLVGLIRPSEGEVRVFGHRVTPGAPVLSRVGAFIEGPGMLPHRSGLDNLRQFWAATGRPVADARFEAVLELADLGQAVHRRVKTYSQGMRQRLAVAQAMLGLPDLLILDEPTNGLDPPQIREMRDALRGYAATGRSVLVSSHLLDEVEQTCTHCAVMHRGRLLAFGAVEELIGAGRTLVVDVDLTAAATAEPAEPAPTPAREPTAEPAVDAVRRALAGLAGIAEVAADDAVPGRVMLTLDGVRPAAVVAALVRAGVPVNRVAPRRRLEDAFLALIEEG